jgi:hypothetical protein
MITTSNLSMLNGKSAQKTLVATIPERTLFERYLGAVTKSLTLVLSLYERERRNAWLAVYPLRYFHLSPAGRGSR